MWGGGHGRAVRLRGEGAGKWAEERRFTEEVHDNQGNVAAAMVRDEQL
jgi:hypothetical protein